VSFEDKTFSMQEFLKNLAKQLFGREIDGIHCVVCGSAVEGPHNFRDELSWKEWQISFLCQACQDETFGKQ